MELAWPTVRRRSELVVPAGYFLPTDKSSSVRLAGVLHCRCVLFLLFLLAGLSVGRSAVLLLSVVFPCQDITYIYTNRSSPDFISFSVVCPIITAPSTLPTSTSLAVSVKIEVGEGESIEQALRRFKREVNKSGHLMELRHRRHFENSQEKKKRKIKEGRMRIRMERMNRRRMQKQRA